MLLIDEIDKSDQEFEAFLLEILSDYQVTHPGDRHACKADVAPIVLLTSNTMRDLGDALKRRCLHLHIGLPDAQLEARIIAARVPGRGGEPAARSWWPSCSSCATLDLKKLPSVSETIDWARVLVLLHARAARPRPGARHAERAAEVRERHRGGAAADRRPAAEGEAGGGAGR